MFFFYVVENLNLVQLNTMVQLNEVSMLMGFYILTTVLVTMCSKGNEKSGLFNMAEVMGVRQNLVSQNCQAHEDVAKQRTTKFRF